MFVCGVDDAGRGSIIGPLVIAGVLVDQNEIHEL
ncbi:MAG: ribonuclease HII, partial [Candidatus Bathyarchaeia archaeon]